MRDTDIKTQNAINPTTKATRKNGFARRNPEAAKEKQRLLKSKHHQNKKKKSLVDHSLSEQEQAEIEQAWGHLSLSLQTSTSSFQEDALLKIITLGEKQRRAWIPEATEKLEKSFGRDESCIFIQKVMRRSAQNNNGQRQIELLHKIIAKLNGVNRLSQFPNKQAGDISSNSPSSVTYGSIPLNSEPWKTACKLLQSLKISCLEKSGCPILRLSKPPIFVNTFDQLIGLQRRLQTCSLVAIDSEWCGQKGSNGNNTQTTIVSTIQISFFEEHPIDTTFLSTFVVDLLVRDDDFHRLAKDLIRWMIFPRERLSNILVLGFAIGHDLPLLKAFVDGSEISNATTQALGSILDLQLVFAAQAETKSSLPGLKACAKRYSSVLPLSKEQQCSDWSQRPLSQAQLEYAGLDAAILLVLLAESSRNMITRKSKS